MQPKNLPLSFPEAAARAADRVGGRLAAADVEALHEASGGEAGAMDALVDKQPAEFWLARGMRANPDSLIVARHCAEAGFLGHAEVYLADSAAEDEQLAGYLAIYAGRRRRARRSAPANPLLALADWSPGELSTSTGAADDSLAILGRAVLTGQRPVGWEPATQRERLTAGWIALAHDDPIAAREYLRPRAGDHPIVRLWQEAWLARTQYVLGDLAGAARTVERGLAACAARGVRLLEPLLLWTGAQTAVMRGEPELARDYILRCDPGSGDDSFLIQRLPAAMGRMIYTAGTAELAVAVRAGEELGRIVAGADTQHPGYWPWEDIYALTLLRAGRITEADAVITSAERRHAQAGLASIDAKNAVVRAGILIQRGQVGAGLATFDGAVERLVGTAMPTYLARVLLEHGKALRRLGHRSRADEVFAHAEEVYQRIGATALAERARGERRAAGLGRRERSARGLTPQEEQVLQLVAQGASNKEAARQLTLSPKTVEYHLTSIYKKLGVRDRDALKGAL